METVALLYEDYQKELAEDFKNTFLKRASDTDSSRSNDTVIDEVTDMLSTNIAVYTEKLLQRWGFSSGGEGGGGGDVTVTLDDLLKKYLSDNYVTIKGDQEVFGEKDFRKGIRIAGRRLYWDEGNDALVIEGAAYTTRWLSAKGVSPGGGGTGGGGGGTGGGGGGAVALYQLLDVEKNADITGVAGATKGSVLTFNGDKWYADKPKTAAGISNLFTALDNDGNEVDLNDESKLGTITNIRANYALWSVDWISAKGKSSGGSGGGGGLINLVYGFESLGGTFDNNDNSATFNAFTINEIWKLASSGLTNVTVTGSGNAVTDVIKGSDGRSLTFTKGSTFATKSEFDALNTKFNDFLTGSDADDIINKWSELEVFLQGMKESDNLAVILQSKMDKTAFSKLFTALDASGNEVDPSDDTKTIASIRANFGFWGVDYISAKGVSKGSGGGSGVVNTVYSFANLTDDTTFSDSDLDNTFNAYTIKKLYDMAGQGGLDADAMWAELKKADSSKIIDASHIPTSVLDGRWVKKTGDTMTGTLTSASSSGAIVFKGVENCDITNIYTDNGVIKNDDGGGLTSIRNGLRFNWYDTYWYIGNLRGGSTESAGFGVVDHNNKLVLRVTPDDVRAPRFMSTVATGLSPLIVSSNTTVDNLNADLLDGVHLAGFGGREGVMRSWLRGIYTTVNQYFGNGNVVTIDPKPTDDATLSANTTVLSLGDTAIRNTQLAFHYESDTIKYRRHDDSKWNDWVVLIHSGNYASYSDGRYVKKSGDTMTGALHLANGTRNNAGDDCGFGDCNIEGCLGLQGLNGATGLAFIQQGASWSGGNNYKFTWNGSNMVSSSTALWNNLNADMLDNWHLNFLPRNYNKTRTYAMHFALGSTDNDWKKILACSESGAVPYQSVTVWGQIWYAYGNHANDEVRNYHFCAIFYMRSGPSSSNSSVGNVENSARLYLPTFAKGMDNIRLVRVGTNNFELQVRQIGSWHNGHIQYQYWASWCNVSAWESLQSTSNTSVAVSAGGASTLADSRASSADVWTSARTFYIQDHNAAHTGAGVSVNGSANVYLKLPNSIQCGDWFRSTGNSGWYHQDYGGGIYMQDSTYVRVYGGKRFYVGNTENTNFSTNTAISTDGGIYAKNNITSSANIIANGAITAKASSSDIRLKTDIQGYDAMGIIRKFRSVKYHWNAIAKENSEVFNHDNWNYGLIAQDLLSGGYSQWVKDAFNDYYTIDYERLIPVVWKGLQEVDDEVTKLKREVARLNKRVEELEKSLCA